MITPIEAILEYLQKNMWNSPEAIAIWEYYLKWKESSTEDNASPPTYSGLLSSLLDLEDWALHTRRHLEKMHNMGNLVEEEEEQLEPELD